MFLYFRNTWTNFGNILVGQTNHILRDPGRQRVVCPHPARDPAPGTFVQGAMRNFWLVSEPLLQPCLLQFSKLSTALRDQEEWALRGSSPVIFCHSQVTDWRTKVDVCNRACSFLGCRVGILGMSLCGAATVVHSGVTVTPSGHNQGKEGRHPASCAICVPTTGPCTGCV